MSYHIAMPTSNFDLLAFGDVHCHYKLLRKIAAFESARAPFAHILTVGDFSDSYKHTCEDPEIVRHLPIIRCGGNHEQFEALESLPGDYLAPGVVKTFKDPTLRILGFGGIYVEDLWEAKSKGWTDRRRRAFTRMEFDQARARKDVDILLTHETARYLSNPHRDNPGQQVVSDVVDQVRPRLHLSGHHHNLVVASYGTTVGFILPIPTTAWVRLHYRDGLLSTYSVGACVGEHGERLDIVAQELPLPTPGTALMGLPGNHAYRAESANSTLSWSRPR